MRAFIGVEFSREIKDSIINIQNSIKENSIKGRWKYVDNFHLTLKFLGEVSENTIKQIADNMKDRLSETECFEISSAGIGCFKGNDCIRVVYISLEDKDKKLEKLFKITEDCCFLSGFEREKRAYTPHITIAQDVVIKRDFNLSDGSGFQIPLINIPVNKISIIKSQQIENKRIYTAIHEQTLKC